MQDCDYCELLKSDIINNLVVENEHAIAIADDYFREGHCTVILRSHKRSISQLEPAEYNAIFELITKISRAIEKKYDCEKTYLITIGDICEHLRFHLIPKHRDKCSMGVYSFEALIKAEGVRTTSEAGTRALAVQIRAIINAAAP